MSANRQSSSEELRQAAEYARAFADLAEEPETKYGFEQLAARWEKEAEDWRRAARLNSLKHNER